MIKIIPTARLVPINFELLSTLHINSPYIQYGVQNLGSTYIRSKVENIKSQHANKAPDRLKLDLSLLWFTAMITTIVLPTTLKKAAKAENLAYRSCLRRSLSSDIA